LFDAVGFFRNLLKGYCLFRPGDEERAKRVKYVRALEKFVKSAVATLKREDFDFSRFEERMQKNAIPLRKVAPIVLDSTYTKSLEAFCNLILETLNQNIEEKEEERQVLLRHANALEKLKVNSSYKKEKHRQKVFDDGY
jgi:hypothetical protein